MSAIIFTLATSLGSLGIAEYDPELDQNCDAALNSRLFLHEEAEALNRTFEALGFFKYNLISCSIRHEPCSWPGVKCADYCVESHCESYVSHLQLSTCNYFFDWRPGDREKCIGENFRIPLDALSTLHHLDRLEVTGAEIVGDIGEFSILAKTHINSLQAINVGIGGSISDLHLPLLRGLTLQSTNVSGSLCGAGLNEISYLSILDSKVGGRLSCLDDFPWLQVLALEGERYFGDVEDLIEAIPQISILRLLHMPRIRGDFKQFRNFAYLTILRLYDCSNIIGSVDSKAFYSRYSILDLQGTRITLKHDNEAGLRNAELRKSNSSFVIVNKSQCSFVSTPGIGDLQITPHTFAPATLCQCKIGLLGQGLECMAPCRFWWKEDLNSLTCYPDLKLWLVGFIIYLTMICYWIFGAIPLEDVSYKAEETHVKTWTRHWLLMRSKPFVNATRFSGTGHPGLDSHSMEFMVRRSRQYCLELCSVNDSSGCQFEASQGYLRFTLVSTLRHRGFVIPVWAWIVLGAGLFSIPFVWTARTEPISVIISINCSFFASFALAHVVQLFVPYAPLRQLVRTFQKSILEIQPVPAYCQKGAGRAIGSQQLLDFHRVFSYFIRERNMYFIVSNIIKPLTQTCKVSYAEFAGPKQAKWFVSHYWGTPFTHFVNAIQSHSKQVLDGNYWICSFSNNQWQIKSELGASWEESSFLMALRSGSCLGTALVLDDNALPLTRSWCLFELVQTFQRKEANKASTAEPNPFSLDLCSPTGVLSKGECSVDMAVSIARRLATLRLEDASATDKQDYEMIQKFVDENGGFSQMNKFIRNEMGDALTVVKDHFETDMEDLFSALEMSRNRAHTGVPQLQANEGSRRRSFALQRLALARGDTLMFDQMTAHSLADTPPATPKRVRRHQKRNSATSASSELEMEAPMWTPSASELDMGARNETSRQVVQATSRNGPWVYW